MFVGRRDYLDRLSTFLDHVRCDADAGERKPGKALLIRGRRRVGKSRLVEEFLEQQDVPHLFFAASGRPVREELRLFADEAAWSDLPGAELFRDVDLSSWDAAFRLLASALPEDRPSVIVIDELPYLIDRDPDIEGTLQRSFDRDLSRKPVLLIGIGSDLSMMEALNGYSRPFHQRASEMVVPPFTPAEVGAMLALDPAEAVDAWLVTGGLPLICSEWEPGQLLHDYLASAVTDPTSALLVSAERSLAAEFPAEARAREVLGAVGSGERTFSNIARAAGEMAHSTLNNALGLLLDKRLIAVDTPLSTKPSREKRYRIADPYLRFWLSFLGPRINEIERGRGDRVLAAVDASWTSWRGRTVEPVLRESLARLSPPVIRDDADIPGVVGSYWTRTNNPEIDIVVADKEPVAGHILSLGSVKWLENAPFDAHDLGELQSHRLQLPGASADTPLIVVSRSGITPEVAGAGVTHIGPDDLIAAYR